MILHGRLVKDTNPLRDATVKHVAPGKDFHDTLQEAFLMLCKELSIPIPLWLPKNTKEFGRFHRTFFPKEQFLEPMVFDRFELTLVDRIGHPDIAK
jgi:hypothetical protein